MDIIVYNNKCVKHTINISHDDKEVSYRFTITRYGLNGGTPSTIRHHLPYSKNIDDLMKAIDNLTNLNDTYFNMLVSLE